MSGDHTRLCLESLITYVEVLDRTGRHDLASKAIGCTTTTTWKWRNRSKADPKDPRFLLSDPLGVEPDETFWDACEAAVRGWLDATAVGTLIEQATGYDDPVIHQGRVCFEPDTSAEHSVDPLTGLISYPPKIDPATGEPVRLVIRKTVPSQTQFLLKSRHPDFKEKSEVDVTSGGRPIFFPAKYASTEEFIEASGSGVDEVKAPEK